KEIDPFFKRIGQLKNERKKRSAILQERLFESFVFLNALKEEKKLPDIFSQTQQKTPPAGAGECAGPKLLQFAYRQELEPIAMAEFWWGDSPKKEIRNHGNYYPACKGKCEPILSHMLKGLEVEENPLNKENTYQPTFKRLYEDEWILCIDKPAGLLSAPGKSDLPSVYSLVKEMYPDATGPLLVHRLDMATSGILLIAKTKETHKILQEQFRNRTVKKKYVAILDGIVSNLQGTIRLPMILDPTDRPRQIVCDTHGKTAITEYEVIEVKNRQTKIAFYPNTGRTHQLRVHAAHRRGLNTPIKGDTLYGKPDIRLFLHAEEILFSHPITHKQIHVINPNPDITLSDRE
ncbi:MAG: RluA family pseudouridine synthase, partial [Bacteroidales bacterium]